MSCIEELGTHIVVAQSLVSGDDKIKLDANTHTSEKTFRCRPQQIKVFVLRKQVTTLCPLRKYDERSAKN